MEKYNEFAGIVSEKEIDDMMTEDKTAAGATTVPCAVIGITLAAAAIVTSMDNCPTTPCTNKCRL